MIVLLKTHEDRLRGHPRGDRAAAREGGVRWAAPRDDPEDLGPGPPPARRFRPHAARQRLRGRACRDARRAAVLASPAADADAAAAGAPRAVLRRPLRLAALRRDLSPPTGAAAACAARASPVSAGGKAPRDALAEAGAARPRRGPPDHVERRGRRRRRPKGAAGREGASRAESSPPPTCATSSTRDEIAETHALAERLARTMRARLVRRSGARGAAGGSISAAPSTAASAHGGTPIDLVWRRRKTSRSASSCSSTRRAR